MSMELKEKVIKMLKGISVDLQAKCEDNEITKTDIKDYFDAKIYNVSWYGIQE